MNEIRIGNTLIKVIKGDLTEAAADAIVNAANNELVMGGGVAGAIKRPPLIRRRDARQRASGGRKGGPQIEDEAVKKGPIAIGAAVATSAGKLRAKYVIHAATMGMDFATDEHRIRRAAASALRVADGLRLRSIAFPALGCGTGGFPALAAAKIMAQEVLRYLHDKKARLKEITFILRDAATLTVFEKGVIAYLRHFVEELSDRPFTTVDIIIEVGDKIVLIERSNPPLGWALPGGFVDYGETLEAAALREAKEETGLDVTSLRQFHTYSDPSRDPRFHTIGTVFTGTARGTLKAGDDAASAKLVTLAEAFKLNLAFDHRKILEDYSCSKKSA